jgi:hypothetical protein
MGGYYSPDQRALIREFVKDTIVWNLHQAEAVQYCHQRTLASSNNKIGCSVSTYKRYRNALTSDKSVRNWYQKFLRVDLMTEHKEAMDRIKAQIHEHQRMFAAESFKPEHPPSDHARRSEWKDKNLMLRITDRLVLLEQTLEGMRLSNETYNRLRENLERIKSVHEKYFMT